MSFITAQQSRDARRELGLSQTDIAKTLDISRQYLSEFETGFSTRLTDSQLKKLRNYYESKIAEANAKGEDIVLTFGEEELPLSTTSAIVDPHTDPVGIQRALLAIRHLAIDPSITHEQTQAILEKVAANDSEAEDYLSTDAESGLFSDWSSETDAKLRSVFGLFAENYVLLRHLQGRPLVTLSSPIEQDQAKTIGDVFAYLFHKANASLIATASTKEELAEEVTE